MHFFFLYQFFIWQDVCYWLHISETQPEIQNRLLVSGWFPFIQEGIPFAVFTWGWLSCSLHYMLEVISLITLEQHQFYLIFILILQHLIPLMLPSTSTAVFIIIRHYSGKTNRKRIEHDFCPSVANDVNFFVSHMNRFRFLWVEIATPTNRHTHMLQPKIFHVEVCWS